MASPARQRRGVAGLAGEAPHHHLGVAHHVVPRQHLGCDRLPPRERQQLARESFRARRRLEHLREVLGDRGLRRALLERELAEAAYDREHVVEIVRDAAGEPTDRFHLLRLAQLRLEPLALARVATHREVARRWVAAQGRERQLDRQGLAAGQLDGRVHARAAGQRCVDDTVAYAGLVPQQALERDAQQLAAVAAQQRRGRRVGELDHAVAIEQQHRIGRPGDGVGQLDARRRPGEVHGHRRTHGNDVWAG
jgi:hypothetical protein